MTEILLYALPCWVFNLFYTFVPHLKKWFPFLSRIDIPLSEKRVGVQGTLTLPIVLLLPLIFLPFILSPYYILLLQSACVALGDIVGSFIKRSFGFPKGKYVPGIDHGDYMIMTGAVFVGLGLVPFYVAFQALIITYLAHPLFCYVGWMLGIKREPL
jgi:CDP-diglyceride synthetase